MFIKPKNLIAEDIVPKELRTYTKDELVQKVYHYAEKYNVKSQTMLAVINCESSFNPNAENKNRNENNIVWSTDKGLFQINDYFHKENAKKLGLNIEDIEDNIEYGAYLMSKQGLTPWSASKKCWNK